MLFEFNFEKNTKKTLNTPHMYDIPKLAMHVNLIYSTTVRVPGYLYNKD